HRAGTGIQAACCDQAIIAGHQIKELVVVDVVAVQHLRVDNNFEQVFAVTADIHLQHFRNTFQLLLDTPRNINQLSFGDRARQGDGQNRKKTDVDLMHSRLFGFVRQFGTRCIDPLTDILECTPRIETGVKFQHDRGMTFAGGRGHFFDAFERAQLLFKRPNEQPIRIFRADTVKCDRNIHHGNRNVRVGFLGNSLIGSKSAHQQKDEEQQGCSTAVQRSTNNAFHPRYPALTALTTSPSRTKPAPRVIISTSAGSPSTHTPSGSKLKIVRGSSTTRRSASRAFTASRPSSPNTSNAGEIRCAWRSGSRIVNVALEPAIRRSSGLRIRASTRKLRVLVSARLATKVRVPVSTVPSSKPASTSSPGVSA